VPDPVRADLFAVALTVGSRYFARDLLFSIFREELRMLKEASLVEEWVAEGEARGRAEGEARGRLAEARAILVRQLRKRFGDLPLSVTERVESATLEWCEEMGERLVDAASLQDLGLQPAVGE
jgi:predicted transposase YdaD